MHTYIGRCFSKTHTFYLYAIYTQTHSDADVLLQQTSMSQMVQVVSMLDVPSLFGSVSFQSKDVRGAQNSLFLFCVNTHLVGNDIWLCDAYKHCENTIHMSTSPP